MEGKRKNERKGGKKRKVKEGYTKRPDPVTSEQIPSTPPSSYLDNPTKS